jgi:hypothetical protein
LLAGDGTVALAYSSDGTVTSNNPIDEERAKVLQQALKQQTNPYQFFLAHFSDIDFQGHYFGATPEWNQHQTYWGAVRNKTKIVQEVMELVDNNTVVFIASDHGMLERGGHGGDAELVTQVPLYVYAKDSNLGLGTPAVPTDARFRKAPLTLTDIAPTISALLGIPVPRSCQGVFIDDLMWMIPPSVQSLHYYDLYRQKKEWTFQFLTTIGSEEAVSNPLVHEPNVANQTQAFYVAKIMALNELFEIERTVAIDSTISRNILVTVLIDIVLLGIFLFLGQKQTGADFLMIFSRASRERFPGTMEANGMALLMSGLAVGAHTLVTILIFMLIWFIRGYDVWDSTYLHTPESVIVYLISVLFPSCFSAFLIIRLPERHYSDPPTEVPPSNFKRFTGSMREFFWPSAFPRYLADKLYLAKIYLVFWTVLLVLGLFVFQATYTFIVPNIFRIKFVVNALWGFRFRLITVQFLLVPLMVGCMLTLRFSFPEPVPENSALDRIYQLKLDKMLDAGKLTEAEYKKWSSLLQKGMESGESEHYITLFVPQEAFQALQEGGATESTSMR